MPYGFDENAVRRLDPSEISLPEGYSIEVFYTNLTTPINMIFTDENEILVADAGITSNNGKVLRLTDTGPVVIAEGFNPPLTGITYHEGGIYVAHRGYITKVDRNGNITNIIEGLPSWGDHHNNRVVFGADGKMYFGQGTATNSGVVGEDNKSWVVRYPFFHDYPGEFIRLKGRNYVTSNFLTYSEADNAYTGAYSPFNVSTRPGEFIKGIDRASGSILRANSDGSELELLAWGLRNPFRIKFDRNNRLFVANHGMDVRGSRPVDNSPDEMHILQEGMWYGWPDYTGGLPVTLPYFKPENRPQPKFVMAEHPMTPPRPFSVFAPHSAIMGFDFSNSREFGYAGDVFIAEFGSEAPETTGGKPEYRVGHRVSRIDSATGRISKFAINKTGFAASYTNGGGFERPIDVVFGPDSNMYIADFGLALKEEDYIPGTGVIWKVSRR